MRLLNEPKPNPREYWILNANLTPIFAQWMLVRAGQALKN
jgi:hypothetical protein